jgi:hypothetical protein
MLAISFDSFHQLLIFGGGHDATIKLDREVALFDRFPEAHKTTKGNRGSPILFMQTEA